MPREVARLSSGAADWVRVCLQAAQLRSQFKSFTVIARELDLPSPREAQRAVRQGIALTPADDVREIRRLEDARLAESGAKLLDIIANPGPLVSQGKVMTDNDGRAYEDRMVQVRAIEALLKVSAEVRKLHGADAPKKTMAITQDMITERIMELRRELGDQADQVFGAMAGEIEPGDEPDGGGPGV